MFTGLIEETGRWFRSKRWRAAGGWFWRRPGLPASVRIGDSVAVNGCCLTVVGRSGAELAFDLLEETLAQDEPGRVGERALG